jgi:hypothetical protein
VTLDTLELKHISFDFDEISRSTTTKPQSLTESMINILGFNSLDVEDEKNEMVESLL